MRHMSPSGNQGNLSRMHLELLYVLSSKRKLDLFEIASLLNIDHISIAEMVDCLIENGLVQTETRENKLKVYLGSVSTILTNSGSGFMPLKRIIQHHKNSVDKYSLYSYGCLKGIPK